MEVPRPTAPIPDHGKRTAIIIGAGPAGLTAALELLRRTDVLPIVLESSTEVGGLSRTVEYKGNRLDIGGHRFFSKSERVMRWWQDLLPLEASNPTAASAGPAGQAAVLLLRERQSRIYFLRRFFAYPLALTPDTLRKLGARRTLSIAASYIHARLRPIRPERNLEDFLINRFGRELYRTFFQSYTEKLWGVPCAQISADWGAQRIRGLSLMDAVRDCAGRATRRRTRTSKPPGDLAQSSTETSLIDRFLYPRLGPGQMWQRAAAEITARGGTIHHNTNVDRLSVHGDRITGVEATLPDGRRATFRAGFVLSTMPVPALIRALSEPAPAAIRAISDGLLFRDFITIGVLVQTLALTEPDGSPLRDNWVYIQEPGIRMTRLQIFNNWSPGMVADPNTVWLGLEYVCSEDDDLWRMPDAELQQFAIRELQTIGLLHANAEPSTPHPGPVLDSCVVRAPKAYPAYFGTYSRFGEVREYLSRFENLFLLGRNGQHRYNNQDHSMLTAMLAVDQIAANTFDPTALWSVNTEQTHHESR